MNTNNSYLLTFEWDKKNEVLEIHCNKQGLENLREILNELVSKADCDHVHLMTNNWGGEGLSSDRQSTENELINHVKIFKWCE